MCGAESSGEAQQKDAQNEPIFPSLSPCRIRMQSSMRGSRSFSSCPTADALEPGTNKPGCGVISPLPAPAPVMMRLGEGEGAAESVAAESESSRSSFESVVLSLPTAVDRSLLD